MSEEITYLGFSASDYDVACRQTEFFDIIETAISKTQEENTLEELSQVIYRVESQLKKYNLFLNDKNIPMYDAWMTEDCDNYIDETCSKITNEGILFYDEEVMTTYMDEEWVEYFKKFIKNILMRLTQRLKFLKTEQEKGTMSEVRKIKRNEIVDCPCGLTYSYSNKSRHIKSIEHNKRLNEIPHPTLETENFCKEVITGKIIETEPKEIIKKNYNDILECPCGTSYTRSNFYHHRETTQHKYYLEHNTQRPTTETCECGLEYHIKNKSIHLISHEHFENLGVLADAKDIKKKQKRLEYNKRAKQEVMCECGGKYTKSNRATHYKSTRHKKYLSLVKDKLEQEINTEIKTNDQL